MTKLTPPIWRDPDRRMKAIIFALVILLAAIGLWLYGQFGSYTYLSKSNLDDIYIAKFWSISWILISFLILYLLRKSPQAPAAAVLLLSAYFVIFYGILFRGTEYGMNGHWGDNGNRYAEILKMMSYNSFFQDWYLKDLTSFYPPLWFAIMAVYAKVLSIEAYQTVKYGYLLVFLVYPWMVYFSWRRLVGPASAAAISVATIFLGYKFLDWIYYEHMTASLFLPWWLYYFENANRDINSDRSVWKFYLFSSVFGAALFMTFYYWFFMALVALPVTLVVRYINDRSWKNLFIDIRHKSVIMAGVALLSAVYWVPLLRSIWWYGIESAQNSWFGIRHADIAGLWKEFSIEGVFVILGVFFAGYLYRKSDCGRLAALFLGGVALVLVDRFLNVWGSSIQSRKVLEFAHVFAMAPLAVGLTFIWEGIKDNSRLRLGSVFVAALIGIVVANEQTRIWNDKKYSIAINQRVPEKDIEVFRSVECSDKVFLTTHYLEACYVPYYLFIPLNNMTAHTAGRYSQRDSFLDQAIKISEPELLAYALGHNRYSAVDYVYLPLDDTTGNFTMNLTQVSFEKRADIKKIRFNVAPDSASDVFVRRHERGLYELVAAPRSDSIDSQLAELYPDIYWHLTLYPKGM